MFKKIWLVVAVMIVAACGGDSSGEPTDEAQATTPTSTVVAPSTASTDAPSTTTTAASSTATTAAPSTTTTAVPTLGVDVVDSVFRSYFDLIAAADYEGARELATGPAAEYASFTEHLDLLSPQPNWQFESGGETATGAAIVLDDGRLGSESTLVYVDGGYRLEVSNPVVSVVNAVPLLDEWGVDLGSGTDQPSLGQRLKLIGSTPSIDPSSCFDTGMWAYVPGGSNTSETVRIIALGLACSVNDDLTPQQENSRLYSSDGGVEIAATIFQLQGGGSSVEMNNPTLYLAIFDVPAAAASANLIWETPFDRSNAPATSFHTWEIGPFDFGAT